MKRALDSVAKWLRASVVHGRVVGSITSQGDMWETTNQSASLTSMILSPPLPLSLKINGKKVLW